MTEVLKILAPRSRARRSVADAAASFLAQVEVSPAQADEIFARVVDVDPADLVRMTPSPPFTRVTLSQIAEAADRARAGTYVNWLHAEHLKTAFSGHAKTCVPDQPVCLPIRDRSGSWFTPYLRAPHITPSELKEMDDATLAPLLTPLLAGKSFITLDVRAARHPIDREYTSDRGLAPSRVRAAKVFPIEPRPCPITGEPMPESVGGPSDPRPGFLVGPSRFGFYMGASTSGRTEARPVSKWQYVATLNTFMPPAKRTFIKNVRARVAYLLERRTKFSQTPKALESRRYRARKLEEGALF